MIDRVELPPLSGNITQSSGLNLRLNPSLFYNALFNWGI